MNKWIFAICVLLSAIVDCRGNAHKVNPETVAKLKRNFSLDNGYITSFNSNRAIKDFDLELSQGFGVVYDYYEDYYFPSTPLQRGLFYCVFNALTWGPSMGQMAQLHEMGHSTRFRSIGIDTNFINIGKAAFLLYLDETRKLTLDDVLSENYFATVLGSTFVNIPLPIVWMMSGVLPRYDRDLLFVPDRASQHYNPNKMRQLQIAFKKSLRQDYDKSKHKDQVDAGEKLNRLIQETLHPKSEVLISGAGPNIQQDRARHAENHLWYNSGDHFTVVNTYFWDKTWSGFQSSSSKDNSYKDNQDTTKVCNAYRKMGISLTHEEIISYAYWSYLLSAQTYANIYQIYQTIMTGERRVFAPEYYGVKLPNVGFYFTTKGPTYNVGSGYKYSDTLFFPVSVEFGLKESAWEGMIGVRKKLPQYYNSYVHAEVVFNAEGIGGTLYAGAEWKSFWTGQLGVTYHNAKTLQGERNIPCYKNGDTDLEVWLKLGVTY